MGLTKILSSDINSGVTLTNPVISGTAMMGSATVGSTLSVTGTLTGSSISAGTMSETSSRIDCYPPISAMYGDIYRAGSGVAFTNNRTVAFNDGGLAEVPIRAKSGETIVDARIYVITGSAISGTLKLFKSPATGTTLTELATVTINASGEFIATANYVVESGHSVYARITIATSSGGNYLYPLRITITGT